MRKVCFLNYFKVLNYSVPKTHATSLNHISGWDRSGNAVQIKTIAENNVSPIHTKAKLLIWFKVIYLKTVYFLVFVCLFFLFCCFFFFIETAYCTFKHYPPPPDRGSTSWLPAGVSWELLIERQKKSIGLISKNNNSARAAHFLPGPSRRLAPVLKCRRFVFSTLHC